MKIVPATWKPSCQLFILEILLSKKSYKKKIIMGRDFGYFGYCCWKWLSKIVNENSTFLGVEKHRKHICFSLLKFHKQKINFKTKPERRKWKLNKNEYLTYHQANGASDFIVDFCSIGRAKLWNGELLNETMRQPSGYTDVVYVLSFSIICFQCANLSSIQHLLGSSNFYIKKYLFLK